MACRCCAPFPKGATTSKGFTMVSEQGSSPRRAGEKKDRKKEKKEEGKKKKTPASASSFHTAGLEAPIIPAFEVPPNAAEAVSKRRDGARPIGSHVQTPLSPYQTTQLHPSSPADCQPARLRNMVHETSFFSSSNRISNIGIFLKTC